MTTNGAVLEVENRKTRRSKVDRHPFWDEIKDLLYAGWSPKTVNLHMSRRYGDRYKPIPERTLALRKARLKAERFIAKHAWEKKLDDAHVLLDTVSIRARMVYEQMGRVDRALQMETDLNKAAGGQAGGMLMVLPTVRVEMETLARLLEGYDESLERIGLKGKPPMVLIQAAGQNVQVNVYDALAERIRAMPPELQEQFVGWLRAEREKRLNERTNEATARLRGLMPPAQDGDE